MNNIEPLAREFLDQHCIAVAGVSPTRDTPANSIFKALRSRGVTVLPVNPNHAEYLGEHCYPDVQSLPQKPDGIVIVTNPRTADALIREAAEAGVRRIWLHNMLGTRPRFMKAAGAKMTSVPADAVEFCRAKGITVIPGSCPMQFVGDPGHRCMRALLRWTGALEAPA